MNYGKVGSGVYQVYGDQLDVQIEVSNFTPTYLQEGDQLAVYVQIATPGEGSIATIQRQRDVAGNRFTASGLDEPTGASWATALTDFKLRLIRDGSTVTAYVWTGAQWEWDGDTNGYDVVTSSSMSSGMRVVIGINGFSGGIGDSGADLYVELDNFIIDGGCMSSSSVSSTSSSSSSSSLSSSSSVSSSSP